MNDINYVINIKVGRIIALFEREVGIPFDVVEQKIAPKTYRT